MANDLLIFSATSIPVTLLGKSILFPYGNSIDFPNKVTGIEVAEKISKSLAKQALIISVDGELKDCWLTTMVSQPIPLGSSI